MQFTYTRIISPEPCNPLLSPDRRNVREPTRKQHVVFGCTLIQHVVAPQLYTCLKKWGAKKFP